MRYAIVRDQMIRALGGECCQCGSTEDLEFNHKFTHAWTPRKVCFYNRLMRYRKEMEAGEIDLRCAKCNQQYEPIERCPF